MQFDRIHGVDTDGLILPEELGLQGRNAVHYAPTHPSRFRAMIHSLPKGCLNFAFIDSGCGKGRALLLAREAGFSRCFGVELSPLLCDIARSNFPGAEIVCCDATEFDFPPVDSVIYMFNPFWNPVMDKFVAHLEESLRRHPRELYVVYASPFLRPGIRRFPAVRKNPECVRKICHFPCVETNMIAGESLDKVLALLASWERIAIEMRTCGELEAASDYEKCHQELREALGDPSQ